MGTVAINGAVASATDDSHAMRERQVAPATLPDSGVYYSKDVGTITEAFYKDSTGAEVQITSGGSLGGGPLVATFLNVGTTTDATTTGDLACGSGNNSMFFDESLGFLSVGGTTDRYAVASPALYIEGTLPGLVLYETDGSADNKMWDFIAFSEKLVGEVLNDAGSASSSWVEVSRTGSVLTEIVFNQDGRDANFRVESDTNATAFKVDGGGTGAIGLLVDIATAGTIACGGLVTPDADSTRDLGETAVRWANLFVDDVTVTTNVNVGGQIFLADGTGAAPSIAFTTVPSTGFYQIGSNGLAISIGGVGETLIDDETFTFVAGMKLGWSSSTIGTAPDVALFRASAGVLQQSDTTNAQAQHIYNTTDSDASPTDYERLNIGWSGNVAEILVQKDGTGLDRPMHIGTNTNQHVIVKTNSSQRWQFNLNGNFHPTGSNAFDIGSTTTEIRSLYVGTSILFGLAQSAVLTAGSSLLTLTGSFHPEADSTRDLGLTGTRWANLFVDDVVATTSISLGATVAAAGAIRLANTGLIAARNAGDTVDVRLLKLTAADDISIGDAFDGSISVGNASGIDVSIGSHASARVGLYAVTPVTRAGATDDIKDSLVAIGILQGTSATPLNLDGGAFTTTGVSTVGTVIPGTANAFDWGSASAEVRSIYIGTSVIFGTAQSATLTAGASLLTLTGSFHPEADSTRDLGLTGTRWANLWVDDVTATAAINIGGALNHDGTTAGLYGATPVVQAAAYTVTNVTPDRAFDADSTTLDEIADVLGTLLEDVRLLGAVAT